MEKSEIVGNLRNVSNQIERHGKIAARNSEMPYVVFPGWHLEFDGESAEDIRKAARAILGEGVTEDEHTLVSYKQLAALVHYVADMLE